MFFSIERHPGFSFKQGLEHKQVVCKSLFENLQRILTTKKQLSSWNDSIFYHLTVGSLHRARKVLNLKFSILFAHEQSYYPVS
jgi:hypothetical protein